MFSWSQERPDDEWLHRGSRARPMRATKPRIQKRAYSPGRTGKSCQSDTETIARNSRRHILCVMSQAEIWACYTVDVAQNTDVVSSSPPKACVHAGKLLKASLVFYFGQTNFIRPTTFPFTQGNRLRIPWLP